MNDMFTHTNEVEKVEEAGFKARETTERNMMKEERKKEKKRKGNGKEAKEDEANNNGREQTSHDIRAYVEWSTMMVFSSAMTGHMKWEETDRQKSNQTAFCCFLSSSHPLRLMSIGVCCSAAPLLLSFLLSFLFSPHFSFLLFRILA